MIRYLINFLVGMTFTASVEASGDYQLLQQVQVGRDGVYLNQVIDPAGNEPLPRLRLTNAPAFGRALYLGKAEVLRLARLADTNLFAKGLKGVDQIRVVRAARSVSEAELKEVLTATLQANVVKDRGELELRLVRSWAPLLVPDDVLRVKVLELPTTGVSPQFICKFELLAGEESCGVFSVPLQAHLWREVYVAGDTLLRGQLLREAKITMERRDLLTTRDAVWELPLDNPYVEIGENIRAGAPITSRSLRLRTIVKRGRVVDALLAEGGMKITAKVEALEDGIPGQVVRVRNIRSKRELKGKVQDEQTIQVLF